jgi:hypothetical protein
MIGKKAGGNAQFVKSHPTIKTALVSNGPEQSYHFSEMDQGSFLIFQCGSFFLPSEHQPEYEDIPSPKSPTVLTATAIQSAAL